MDKNCINHPEQKHYAKGLCVICYSQKVRERTKNDPVYRERERVRGRRNWALLSPEQKLDKAYRRNYQMTYVEVQSLLASQNFSCKACGDNIILGFESGVVDHCHTTNMVRGILCSPCNKALGHVYDDINRLRGLITYLEQQELRIRNEAK